MPYDYTLRRNVSMSRIREDWLMQHKQDINAIPVSAIPAEITDGAKHPAQTPGKWQAWRKAFVIVGIDARYMEASTPASSKKVWSVRSEIADYIRRNAPELISGGEYEKRNTKNRRAQGVNMLMRKDKRFEDS